jgi:hypothetical protein
VRSLGTTEYGILREQVAHHKLRYLLGTPKAFSDFLGNTREDTMDDQQATDIEIGWLAGIIDGEGWIGMSLETEHFYRKGYNTRQKSVKVEIKVVNTDPAIIVQTAMIMRKLGVNPYLRSSSRTGEKRDVYEASIKRMAPVQRVLQVIQPHLVGTKQQRANIMLQFIELRQTNPGVPNPAYANGAKGRHGPGTIRPYTVEELELVEQCRALQARSGASETTRAASAAILAAMKTKVARGSAASE